ncbi:thymidylate synthase [Methanolobus sp. WCC5]|uniref:thymidylate synthase n=1 Tax=Methanolobus sp. WCC5 TaxID=3125785 RepID=UPI003254EB00
MNDMETVLIKARTISSAWSQLIHEIYHKGEVHKPDYGTMTKRVHATIYIEDVNNRQVNAAVPFGENLIKKYKEELTEEYADWYVSLAEDDKRKFDYCYAKQLFRYGETAYNTLQNNVKNIRPGSRRHVGVLWENEVHIPKYEDQPCWIAYKIELLNDKQVRIYILYRSWDAFGGFPANIPAIVEGFKKVFREQNLSFEIESLIATGWDTHIYESDLQAVEKILRINELCPICRCLTPKHSFIQTTKGKACPECKKSM